MVDPLGSQYAHNSLYTFQENKLGMGVELEGAELAEFDRYLGGVVSGIVEDVTLGAFRAGSGSPEYNEGVSAGHKASVAIGGTSTVIGTGIVGGSGVVTVATAGVATPATAVTAVGGTALGLYGTAITAKALSSVNSEGKQKSNNAPQKEHIESSKSNSEYGTTEKMGRSNGNSPRNNQAQNEQTSSLSKKYNLTNKQQEVLHRDISKKGYSYKEVEKRIQELFKPKEK